MQVEDRLAIDYQILKELAVPLRDVMNYEAHNSDDSRYQKLAWAQSQLNSSLEEIQNIVSTTFVNVSWLVDTIISYMCLVAK